MTLAVEFYPEATTDLLAASDWSESHRPGTGEKLLLAADKAMERVAMWPESGSPEAVGSVGASIRSVRLTGTRYRAVYMVIEQTLWVIAVAHDRQMPGFWLDRLR